MMDQLMVVSGPSAGKTITLRPGRIVQVGRSGWADLSIPLDRELADLHFLLECDPTFCKLRDLGSPNGTIVNGSRASNVVLSSGDTIEAGGSSFQVLESAGGNPGTSADMTRFEPVSSLVPVPIAPSPPRATEDTGSILRRIGTPLFAILDAAREPTILRALKASSEQHQSLYEGEQGEILSQFAPYLVSIPKESRFLDSLVSLGWGKSWGVYLRTDVGFLELRKHLRHFLMVESEAGKAMYFRFYDPRVLRVFLPTCSPEELRTFFGPIRHYFMEDEDGANLLELVVEAGQLKRKTIPTIRPSEK
jgi:pSer/pThr/pTyr-binding forkhead associated (FHA) protein